MLTSQRLLALSFSSAWILGFTLAGVHGSVDFALWFTYQLALALLFVLVVRSVPPTFTLLALVAYMGLLLAVLVLTNAAAFIANGMWATQVRSTLIYSNANLLAVSITLTIVAIWTLTTSLKLRLFVAFSGAVLLFAAGSRASIAATIIGVLIASIITSKAGVHRLERVSHWRVAALAVMMFVLLGGASLLLNTSGNLLRDSTSFGPPAWSWRDSTTIQVRPVRVGISTREDRGARITGNTANDHRLIMWQGTGKAIPGVRYVASAYFRSDVPDTLELSSNLASVQCEVHTQWARCSTPPAERKGADDVQFRISTMNRNSNFDFEVWGPQVEVSDLGPTEYSPRKIFSSRFFRAGHSGTLQELLGADRIFVISRGIELFRANPLAGVGLGRYELECVALGESTGTCLGHAHNQFVHVLAETGLIGLFAFMLPIIGVFVGYSRRAQLFALPILVVQLLLALTDATYYHVGNYVTFWVALAVAAHHDSHSSG